MCVGRFVCAWKKPLTLRNAETVDRASRRETAMVLERLCLTKAGLHLESKMLTVFRSVRRMQVETWEYRVERVHVDCFDYKLAVYLCWKSMILPSPR